MNDGARLLYLLLAGVLVGSALLARRPSLGMTMRMALVWIAIFAAGYVLFGVWRGF